MVRCSYAKVLAIVQRHLRCHLILVGVVGIHTCTSVFVPVLLCRYFVLDVAVAVAAAAAAAEVEN